MTPTRSETRKQTRHERLGKTPGERRKQMGSETEKPTRRKARKQRALAALPRSASVHGKPGSVASEYRGAIARAVIRSASLLSSAGIEPVGKRRLVNFLRGNQIPRSPGTAASDETFGLLGGHRDEWIEEAVDRLLEAGYLSLEPRRRGLPPGLVPAAAGARALSGGETFPPEALPEHVRLGSHPETEERLRLLRRELARAEGRAPYGIFPNATLAALAQRRPTSLAQLAEVPGLGEARVRRYGRRILKALAASSGRLGGTARR